MTDLNIDSQVRDILRRCSYSNDNVAKSSSAFKNNIKTEEEFAISIVGNNNIVVEADFLYSTFLFLIGCFWMYLYNR